MGTHSKAQDECHHADNIGKSQGIKGLGQKALGLKALNSNLSLHNMLHNRVIRKVRKRQHQKNPEFGHTWSETQKTNNFGGKQSFIWPFPFSWTPQLALHIFSLFLPIQVV